MKLIFGLMLLNTAACLEFNCSFYQSDPCYAALGHKLNLLMLDTRIDNRKILKRITSTQDDQVCGFKDGRIREKECDLFNNRSEVSVINGILIINGVIGADSGTYRLDLEDSNGTETSRDLQVIVEEKDAGKTQVESSVSLVFVLVWCFQMMFLLGLLGGFHIYMRHTSGKKQEDQQVRMSRFREGHERTAED
ncbi:uncharacterized protein si:zfos-741a10.3 isoform X3 [Megalobrama amblycephala]|uniref:uncharacterized protein si:zfos-741a10.3 isoform X3 n=1 Tax=Megalobrama amblycephala TaxID=75352 RepID=UPI00201459D2|nr:uncharacterized protein si:zfos-741a10.3 isoform X3 [Megalobrama amblycephala]